MIVETARYYVFLNRKYLLWLLTDRVLSWEYFVGFNVGEVTILFLTLKWETNYGHVENKY